MRLTLLAALLALGSYGPASAARINLAQYLTNYSFTTSGFSTDANSIYRTSDPAPGWGSPPAIAAGGVIQGPVSSPVIAPTPGGVNAAWVTNAQFQYAILNTTLTPGNTYYLPYFVGDRRDDGNSIFAIEVFDPSSGVPITELGEGHWALIGNTENQAPGTWSTQVLTFTPKTAHTNPILYLAANGLEPGIGGPGQVWFAPVAGGKDVSTALYATPSAVSNYLVAMPHLAFGGPWRTKIIIRNTSDQPADVTLYYYDDAGRALSVPFGGAGATSTKVTVPADGFREVEPDYSAAQTQSGWAGIVYADPGVKVQGVFLWHDAGDPPDKYIESAVPVIDQTSSFPSPGFTMPYDETEGRFSGYGFANTTNVDATVSLRLYDAEGAPVGTYSQSIPAFGHVAFLLKDKIPAATGRKGGVTISGPGIVPLGLRFTPYTTFTTWQP